MTAHWTDALVARQACHEAVEWARGYDSLAGAWAACRRGDWMLWLAGRCAGEPGSDLRRLLVLAACDCAELALPHVPADELRPAAAIATARRWARGDATLAEVRAAAYASAATDATYAAAAAAATDATYAATYASAATYATYAAYAASYAAYAASYASYAAASAASAARIDTLARCADIVRRHYPEPPVLP